MWTKLFPNECEFCGSKKVKKKSPIGAFYLCPKCGMIHGQLSNNNECKQTLKTDKGR